MIPRQTPIGAAGLLLITVLAGAAGGEPAPQTPRGAELLATGRAELERGRLEEAAATLQQAAALFAEAGASGEQLEALLQLSQAQLALGSLGEAGTTLAVALPLAERAGSPAQRAAAQLAAGTLRLSRDEPGEAEPLLRGALAAARESGDASLAAAAELNLGTLQAARGDAARAVDTLTAAAEHARAAGRPELAARALANGARSLVRAGETTRALALVERASVPADAGATPPPAVLVHLAVTLREVAKREPARAPALRRRAHELLVHARDAAEASGDTRSQAHALAYLAELYESEGRLDEALALNRRALLVGTSLAAPESTYRWQWQSGRLLAALGREAEAEAAYASAVRSLGAVAPGAFASERSDTSFREAVDPVYRGLVDLLLRRAAREPSAEEADALRRRARELLEESRAEELRDYFRDECVDATRARVKEVGSVSGATAVIHPVVLDDRLELLVELPGGDLRQLTVDVDRARFEAEVERYRRWLLRRTTRQYRAPARRLYGWLVAPWQEEAEALGVDTLVFVPDPALRTVPMAALHDGERFLVERFALAVTPGLELTDPRPLDLEKSAALLAGVTRPVGGFPALTHAGEELGAVQEVLGGKLLLDESFQREALETALAEGDFGIVHVASHGEFAAEFDESFLVAWDGRLSGAALAGAIGLFRFRDEPLELLTLSACETGRGGERAALGLLGISVKAGARGALGSLWKVNDESTALLMRSFYTELAKPDTSRAKALQRAQLRLLEHPAFGHPLYWSGFLLIGSWL